MNDLEQKAKAIKISRMAYALLLDWYGYVKVYRRFVSGPGNEPVQLFVGQENKIYAGTGECLSQFQIDFASDELHDGVRLTNRLTGKVVFVSQYNEKATAAIIAEAIVKENFYAELANAYDLVADGLREKEQVPPATEVRPVIMAMQVLKNATDWTLRNLYTEYLEVENNQDDAAGVLAKITGAFESLTVEAADIDEEEDRMRSIEWKEGTG
jgi:hypothetical protein